MSTHFERRPSSWFGPQFDASSFPTSFLRALYPSPRNSLSRDAETYEPRRSSNLKTMIQPHITEPLFHDSYLSSIFDPSELSPSTPNPHGDSFWDSTGKEDLLIQNETLADFGLSLKHVEEGNTVATFVSIINVGKPKVIDIAPVPVSRHSSTHSSPRQQTKSSTRPPIVWRMPSYDSTSPHYEISYPSTQRSESFDSESTSASSFSFSDGPKTPTFTAARGNVSRSSSVFRRHSRNLSASFSKTFLSRSREPEHLVAEQSHPQKPLTTTNAARPPLYSNVTAPVSLQPRSALYGVPNMTDAMSLSSSTPKIPALRRKKSISDVWF